MPVSIALKYTYFDVFTYSFFYYYNYIPLAILCIVDKKCLTSSLSTFFASISSTTSNFAASCSKWRVESFISVWRAPSRRRIPVVASRLAAAVDQFCNMIHFDVILNLVLANSSYSSDHNIDIDQLIPIDKLFLFFL